MVGYSTGHVCVEKKTMLAFKALYFWPTWWMVLPFRGNVPVHGFIIRCELLGSFVLFFRYGREIIIVARKNLFCMEINWSRLTGIVTTTEQTRWNIFFFVLACFNNDMPTSKSTLVCASLTLNNLYVVDFNGNL